MKLRAQLASVFHLDKCIGCHTCSVACKNQWTDRRGLEYAWWNNVETRPGTGYPTLWEDQERWRGGFRRKDGTVQLRQGGKVATLGHLFHNPALPVLQDYYEPFTFRYADLFDAPEGEDQPVARAVSTIDGRELEIRSGPNWDDDLGGSNVYAANDPNLARRPEQPAFFWLPRVCNHCLNPACVAACPSGAIYKRGEDGAVLIAQDKCRSWRMCVSACPYKKVFQNWSTGKSEKCIFCYPRLEAGEAPACFHACTGRIRYLGLLLYDADGMVDALRRPDDELVMAQRDLIVDPASVPAGALPEPVLDAARRSPAFRFVKEWGLALPLHAEYRTLPMLFYVPPLLPPPGLPIDYFARLFAAGNSRLVEDALRRQAAVRLHRAGDDSALAAARLTPEQADEIFRLTALASLAERVVVPPLAREEETDPDEPQAHHAAGFGFLRPMEGR